MYQEKGLCYKLKVETLNAHENLWFEYWSKVELVKDAVPIIVGAYFMVIQGPSGMDCDYWTYTMQTLAFPVRI